jgi:hypothetical protein
MASCLPAWLHAWWMVDGGCRWPLAAGWCPEAGWLPACWLERGQACWVLGAGLRRLNPAPCLDPRASARPSPPLLQLTAGRRRAATRAAAAAAAAAAHSQLLIIH